jgi:hypothetical protein
MPDPRKHNYYRKVMKLYEQARQPAADGKVFIGSSMGYLGTFGSHLGLTRSYLDCGLDINLLDYQGTNKRKRPVNPILPGGQGERTKFRNS